ncbi:MAG: transposase, partial [Acidobacteria bacterium]|nr:transposase [Acidobacteriota bacterium]
MSKSSNTPLHLTASPVYLAASAVNNLITDLPAGTAYFIGIVLVTMFTGQLVHHQGSLARAAWPYVVHLRWGWHRTHRAMERGRLCVDALFDRAFAWSLERLPVEAVRLGSESRSVHAIDSSTIARLRAKKKCALLGKGYCHRARRGVSANIVAVLTTVVMVNGLRVGLVRRARCGPTCEEAGAHVFADLPQSSDKRLFSVDAGIATREQFAQATDQDALVGRLRKNASLRRAPRAKRSGQRGRPPLHGPVLHPGAKRVEGRPDEDTTIMVEGREVRVRRWSKVHFPSAHQTIIDVVRVDDAAYKRPLLIGTTARELTTTQIRQAYGHRWPVETNFFVAQGTCAMEMPRAWSERAVERRISLALLSGSLLKAIASACEALPMGPWDRKAVSSAGRLANHLGVHTSNFVALALKAVVPGLA